MYYFFEQQENKATSTDNIKREQQQVDADGTKNLTRNDFLPNSKNQIIHHKTYSLSYNEYHEQADWTAHILRATDTKGPDYKRPYFEVDKMVSTGAASWRNYKNSGYDKGHLVPAGDRKNSQAVYEETFLTSNISPQNHDFNAGIWNRLEQKVRYYAQRHDEVYVITGPILKKGLKSIGSENVSVPQQFYKIIYRNAADGPKMIAFLVDTTANRNSSIYDYMTSVDTIESLTGNDFFYQLPDGIENTLEKAKVKTGW